jgi:hypothetical protein
MYFDENLKQYNFGLMQKTVIFYDLLNMCDNVSFYVLINYYNNEDNI